MRNAVVRAATTARQATRANAPLESSSTRALGANAQGSGATCRADSNRALFQKALTSTLSEGAADAHLDAGRDLSALIPSVRSSGGRFGKAQVGRDPRGADPHVYLVALGVVSSGHVGTIALVVAVG